MSVLVTCRGENITQGMRRYATEKGDRLRRFFNGIHKCEVILEAHGSQFRAETILHLDGAAPIASHAEEPQLNAAIDLMVDRAEKQLKKHKEKIRDHHARDAKPVPEDFVEDPDAGLETYDEVIAKRDFTT